MIRGTHTAHQRARQLRKEMTKSERLLWNALRANRIGWHFRRQHAAGPYVLDFYCHAAALCVEIDGEQHDFRQNSDNARDVFRGELGIRTLRFSAQDVTSNLEGVVQHVTTLLATHPSPAATPSLKERS